MTGSVIRVLRAAFALFLVFSLMTFSGDTARGQDLTPPVYLNQGWTPKQRQNWYTVSQGSRLLPASWMRALELADSEKRFLAPENMRRYGYLYSSNSAELPVGFVIDVSDQPGFETPAIGMNCAACHTGELKVGAKSVRIDGAPALADFETFMSDLLSALRATRDVDAKFLKFAAKVLHPNDTKGARARLKAELNIRTDWYKKLSTYNKAPSPYGYGRLDAQGHILNKISLVVGVADQIAFSPSDAPVSYPHIWNAHQHDRVQWNGVAENGPTTSIRGNVTDFGALGRNTGEVLGVFAEIDVDANDWSLGYRTSVRVDNLIELERLLMRLQSPRWPAQPSANRKVTSSLVQEIFNSRELKDYAISNGPKLKCVACHHQLKSTDTTKKMALF